MCLAYLSFGEPRWPLRIAANRDEFHLRPTRPAAPWPEATELIAGQDLTGGGTWLGWTRQGRFALLTNYREPGVHAKAHAPSRGRLTLDFLRGTDSAADYMHSLVPAAPQWAGFNLIVGDAQDVWYFSNRDPAGLARKLAPGRYLLSNHLLDTPWPKAERLRQALDSIPAEQWVTKPETVFAALRDTTPAIDDELPRTGLDTAREQLLSSPFIISPEYGTRCSTVLVTDGTGHTLFSEQTYTPAGAAQERHDWWISEPEHRPQ